MLVCTSYITPLALHDILYIHCDRGTWYALYACIISMVMTVECNYKDAPICDTGQIVRSSPGTATMATTAAPKQAAVKKQSAASILSSFTASAPSHTPSVAKKQTPPPATPTSPKLDLGSPTKESEGQPKRVPIPSANKSFEMFKKQALEKSERVCMFECTQPSFIYWLCNSNVCVWTSVLIPCYWPHVTCTHHAWQEKQAKQQEEMRKQQIKHAELERQKRKTEDTR